MRSIRHKGPFIIYGQCVWEVGGGGTFFKHTFLEGRFFFNALFLWTFFRESDITCIITVVGAQQQHKGMFLKHGGGGQKFSNSVMEGVGGALFFTPIDFAEPPPIPSAIK